MAYGELGSTAWRKRDFADAKKWLELSVENARLCFGPDSSGEATGLHQLGMVAFDEGELDVALAHFQESLRMVMAHDPDSSKVGTDLNNIGNVYFRRKEFARAGDYYERALTAKRRRLGDKHPALASSYINLGLVAIEEGDAAAAEERCHTGLILWEAALPKDHASLTAALDCIADAQRRQGKAREAVATAERSLAIYAGHPSSSQGDRGAAELVLARVLWDARLDRPRALALARAARARMVADGAGSAEHLAELDRQFGPHLHSAR
jgi:tetratricopeptide (TPR) repeat protein